MKKQQQKIRIFRLSALLTAVISLSLFILNFTPLYAQEMYIDIIGGGYKISGPNTILLPSKLASFENQLARADIREPLPQEPAAMPYMEITDENGSSALSVDVDSTDFTGPVKIPKNRFYFKNCDDPETKECLTAIEGEKTWIRLDPSTEKFTPFGATPLPLLNGNGQAPGKWRIYPSFQLDIPAGTPPGKYNSTITFTIS